MTLADFINFYEGQKVDYDGVYGAQCVDLFRQYCKDVLEIPVHTGAVEGAKDLFLNYKNMPYEEKYFERLPPAKTVQMGDVAVWGSTPTNKYGHVAIILGYNETQFLVMEQDGFKQDGAKIVLRSRFNYLGALRRKTNVR